MTMLRAPSVQPFAASTGIAVYGFRYYSPELGRWLSKDPMEEKGGLNLYANCENDLLNAWDVLGMWKRNNWSGAPPARYEGKATCPTDTSNPDKALQELARAVTNRDEDKNVIHFESDGTTVDIAPLLERLESTVRREIVDATSRMNCGWNPVQGGFTPYDQNFQNNVSVDDAFHDRNPPNVCCTGAADLVMREGLRRAVGTTRYEKIKGTSMKRRNAEESDAKNGDWGYFENDQRYLNYHPDGAMSGENVIKISAGRWWGHPSRGGHSAALHRERHY